jgi:hypothetical protein
MDVPESNSWSANFLPANPRFHSFSHSGTIRHANSKANDDRLHAAPASKNPAVRFCERFATIAAESWQNPQRPVGRSRAFLAAISHQP